ncbi:MAG: formylmethanofuran dehydrogenase subunit E family protein [Dehalococcoidia bacterium]|nr:formylmethanofuran dehydrogenase subunit E family protein [Dehalococcoidia bacterium]
MKIAADTFDEYLRKVRSFHGNAAPGVMLGGIMVSLAQSKLPPSGLYDAICETDRCLPDAVQMLTPCTIGNGWLRILNTGRFSVTLYDKHTGVGVRVFVAADKVKKTSEINKWFFGLVSKQQQDTEKLLGEIELYGESVLGVRSVQVDMAALVLPEPDYVLCASCGESHLAGGGGLCLICRSETLIADR